MQLVPTPKVVELVRERFPDLYMVTFKYQEGVSHEELMEVGRSRLERLAGRGAVVANRGEETGPHGEQVAWLVSADGEPRRMQGKGAIAAALADHLEATLS
jgi:phosphopantothenoylcysteine decarboxylase/phosphopantothenate--cysteine ligase